MHALLIVKRTTHYAEAGWDRMLVPQKQQAVLAHLKMLPSKGFVHSCPPFEVTKDCMSSGQLTFRKVCGVAGAARGAR